MNKAVFLTGGSGFVGQNVIPYLVRNGYTVYALSRSDIASRKVAEVGGRSVPGNLFDLDYAQGCMKDCHTVIHCAAYMDFLTFDYDLSYQVNVQGTKHLLQVAHYSGIQKFIYISAASVMSGGVVKNVNETYKPKKLPGDPYSKTKALAEELVIQAAQPGFETITLRPPLIWGPNNPQNAEIRKAVSEGRWVWIGGGKHMLSTIHVVNLAAAIIAAIDRGRSGQVYYVTDGEHRSIKEFFTELLQTEGIELGSRSIPRHLALFVAYTVQFFWKLFRIKARPPMTPVMVHLLGTEFSVSDGKARTETGYQNALSIDEGLRRLKTFDLGKADKHS